MMLKWLKDNTPIWVLLLVVIAGIWYSWNNRINVFHYRSTACSTVVVPSEIKGKDQYDYCQCVLRQRPRANAEQHCIAKVQKQNGVVLKN